MEDATSYPDVSNVIPTVKPVQEPNIYQEIIDNWQETPETLPEEAPEPNPEGKKLIYPKPNPSFLQGLCKTGPVFLGAEVQAFKEILSHSSDAVIQAKQANSKKIPCRTWQGKGK